MTRNLVLTLAMTVVVLSTLQYELMAAGEQTSHAHVATIVADLSRGVNRTGTNSFETPIESACKGYVFDRVIGPPVCPETKRQIWQSDAFYTGSGCAEHFDSGLEGINAERSDLVDQCVKSPYAKAVDGHARVLFLCMENRR